MTKRFLVMVLLLTLSGWGRSDGPPALVQPVCRGGQFIGLVLVPLKPAVLRIAIDLREVCKGKPDNVPEGFGSDAPPPPKAARKGPQA